MCNPNKRLDNHNMKIEHRGEMIVTVCKDCGREEIRYKGQEIKSDEDWAE